MTALGIFGTYQLRTAPDPVEVYRIACMPCHAGLATPLGKPHLIASGSEDDSYCDFCGHELAPPAAPDRARPTVDAPPQGVCVETLPDGSAPIRLSFTILAF